MGLVRWRFDDPQTGDSYVFDVNPNDGGTPPVKRNIGTEPTTTGRQIAYEGRKALDQGEFLGVSLSQAQYDAFVTWFQKTYPIQMTDDLGRVTTLVMDKLQLKRGRAAHSAWKHTYTVSYYVVAFQDVA